MKKARPDIWMPLYVADYLADTSHLTTEQSGAYLHLLMHSWRVGPLPTDEAILQRITRLSVDAWSIAWPMLSGFFEQCEDGTLIQARLESERTSWSAKKTVNVVRAKLAASKRWKGKEHSDAPSIALSNAPSTPQAMLERCPSSSPSPIKDLKDSRQNLHFDGETADTSEEQHSAAREDREAVKRVFAYYLEKLGKSPKQYELTEKRMRKGVAALRACRKRLGDGLQAEEALGAAVDGLLANKWLMGANPQTKKYTDWESYVVKDIETMEKRWEDGGFKPDVHG